MYYGSLTRRDINVLNLLKERGTITSGELIEFMGGAKAAERRIRELVHREVIKKDGKRGVAASYELGIAGRSVLTDLESSRLDEGDIPYMRKRIWAAYNGLCQYCPFPKSLPLTECHLDHIIPRAIPLMKVKEHYINNGVDPSLVEIFWNELLPQKHDDLENFTLACSTCNLEKGASLLNLASMDLLLRRAKKEAARIKESGPIYSGGILKWPKPINP